MTTQLIADGSRRGTGRRTRGYLALAVALVAIAGNRAAAGDPPALFAPAVLPPLVSPPAVVPPVMPAKFQAPATPPAATQPISVVAPPTGPAPKATPTAPPGGGMLTNPLLASVPSNVGAVPETTAAAQAKVDKHVARVIDPELTLDLVAGQTRVLVLKSVPFRIQSGDERFVGYTVSSPREILVQGREVGTTVMNLWFGDRDDPTKQETLTYLVRVYPDPQAKARLEAGYKALEEEINRYFKECNVRLKLVGDKLVVSGRVRDFVQGGQILRVVRANMSGDAARVPVTTAAATDPATLPIATIDQFLTAGGQNIINLLEVPGEQQVQLKVIVAEVNRLAARSIGLNLSVRDRNGVTVFSNTTGIPGTGAGFGGTGLAGGGGLGLGVSGQANIVARLDGGRIPLAINALRSLEYARSLTDTALVAMNGQTATFQSGGQFPVPITAGVGAGNIGSVQGVQYVPFGVQLSFTPFITDRDRIRLNLQTNVSTRDIGIGTQIGGGNVAGLNTRNVNTTVELRQGETLAIAGLIETNLAAQAGRVPFFGDLPYLSALTGSQRVQAGEKELVIFVTPELTRPLDPGQMPPLPGSEILDPGDFEFYLLGRLEGHCRDYRSPIRTDWSRIRQFGTIEAGSLAGPSGYTPYPIP